MQRAIALMMLFRYIFPAKKAPDRPPTGPGEAGWMPAVVPAKNVEESVGEALSGLGVFLTSAASLIG